MRSALTKTLPLLATAGLLLTGCGAQNVESLDDLATAWEDYSGETCKPDPDPTDESWVCSDKANLSFYEDPEQMEADLDFMSDVWTRAGLQNEVLVGDDWTVAANDEDSEAMRKKIGGEIVVFGADS
jgi:hypothetical protein